MTDGAQAGVPVDVRRLVTICNKLGLHARAAVKLAKAAAQFNAQVWVRKNGTEAAAGDIMELLMLGAGPGTVVELAARGPQAQEAIATLAGLIECKFDES
jgi:phosphotransferase system HPr (HPr) family protein